MSRSQLARTPENFPRMKHRAAGRLLKKKALMSLPQLFAAVGEFLTRAVDGLIAMGKAMAGIVVPTQADFALVPGPETFADRMARQSLAAVNHESWRVKQ